MSLQPRSIWPNTGYQPEAYATREGLLYPIPEYVLKKCESGFRRILALGMLGVWVKW